MSAVNLRAMQYARTVCMEAPDMRMAPRALLLLLSTYADQAGVCWPSVGTLANVLGLTPANVRRARRDLVGRGLIALDARPGHSSIVRFPVVAHTLRAVPRDADEAAG